MINITPTNYYNTNFKANPDYSKIYKEMEKISVKSDEKIIPKVNFKDKFLSIKNFLSEKYSYIKNNYSFSLRNLAKLFEGICTLVLLLGGWGAFVCSILYGVDRCTTKQPTTPNLYDNFITKQDSINTMLKDKAISFDEYKQKMNKIMEEYGKKINKSESTKKQ